MIEKDFPYNVVLSRNFLFKKGFPPKHMDKLLQWGDGKNKSLWEYFKKYPDEYNLARLLAATKDEDLGIVELEDIILERKSSRLSLAFAKYVKNANIAAHNKVILQNTADISFVYRFAAEVEGADIKSLERAMLESRNVPLCYEFARDVKEANIKELEKVVLKETALKMQWINYSSFFAAHVEGADIRAHEKLALEYGSYGVSEYYISNVKGADIEAHEKVMIDRKKPEMNFLFSNHNVKVHEDILLSYRKPWDSYYFVKLVKGADIEKHKKFIKERGDPFIIRAFEKLLKEIDGNE